MTIFLPSEKLDCQPKNLLSGDLPYVLALVDLEEGVRMMTRIVDCDPEEVHIGMDVEVTFEEVTDEIALPMFRPVDPALRKAVPDEEEAKEGGPDVVQAMGPETYKAISYEMGARTTQSAGSH